MNTKKKLQIWGWLLLCSGSLVFTDTVACIHHTDIFGFKELLSLIMSVLALLYGYTLYHTARSVDNTDTD